MAKDIEIEEPKAAAASTAAGDQRQQVTVDATKTNRYIPQTAAEWTALGLVAPNSLWPCQESSGNLLDVIGSLTL